ncbi:MAG: phosphatase PAP2 family protein [Lachnospiraceae bacterium]
MIETLVTLDGSILLWIQESIRNPVLTPVMKLITSLGNAGMIWIAATLLLLISKKTRRVGCMSALALIGSLLINNMLIKVLVARPRPFVRLEELVILIPKPSEYSFPSGHTASSFAAGVVFFRNLPRKWGIPALILAFLIGLTRMYVGVHYPTDVLAGMITGTLLALGAERIVKKLD